MFDSPLDPGQRQQRFSGSASALSLGQLGIPLWIEGLAPYPHSGLGTQLGLGVCYTQAQWNVQLGCRVGVGVHGFPPSWPRGPGTAPGGPGHADPAHGAPSQQERLQVPEQRTEMEEKVSKRGLDSVAKAGPGLLPRKAAGTAGAYGKAVSPPPSPRGSPVAALKAKVIQKLESASKPPTYTYPDTPSAHPTSPPPAPGIARKEEAPENVVEKKDLEVDKETPSPFQTMFSGEPGITPFQSTLDCSQNQPLPHAGLSVGHLRVRSSPQVQVGLGWDEFG